MKSISCRNMQGCLSLSLLTLGALTHLWPLVAGWPQLVAIRHPETNLGPLEPMFRRPRFQARPGHVIVHFDQNHDIQHLQYVLQDGRLATLFQRHNHPANGPIPMQVPYDTPVQRRDEQANPPERAPTGQAKSKVHPPLVPVPAGASKQFDQIAQQVAHDRPPRIDHDQTIEILDSKLRTVSKLVGDHVTLDLNEAEKAPNGPKETIDAPVESIDGGHPPTLTDEKLDILATVAVDAIAAGAQIGEAKLKKAGGLLEKLKRKVMLKLHELPAIIDKKLSAKSTAGQFFVDQAGHRYVLVEEHPSQQPEKQTAALPPRQHEEKSANYGPAAGLQGPVNRAHPVQPASQDMSLSHHHLVD